MEHRSSALAVYDHVVGSPWYRLRQLPAVLAHMAGVMSTTVDGFNRHVPLEDRRIDARSILPGPQLRRQFAGQLPFLVPVVAKDIDFEHPVAMGAVPPAEQRRAYLRVLASQTPRHDPTDQPLPAFAEVWRRRYERGDDVTRWYSSRQEA